MKNAAEQLESLELFAWVGEDELGTGKVGLKQGHCAAGLIPLVSIERSKVEKMKPQMEAQALRYGKRIRLCRFVLAETVNQTECGD